jgi:hypothetical protein
VLIKRCWKEFPQLLTRITEVDILITTILGTNRGVIPAHTNSQMSSRNNGDKELNYALIGGYSINGV